MRALNFYKLKKRGRLGRLGIRPREGVHRACEQLREFPEEKLLFPTLADFLRVQERSKRPPKLPRPGTGKLRQGRSGARISGLGARPKEGTQDSRVLRAA